MLYRNEKEIKRSAKGSFALARQITIEYYDCNERHLMDKGYLLSGVEEFVLKDLQGIKGLKALRVSVNMDQPEQQETSVQELISEALQMA